MTQELRLLLWADNRCYYCREKCASTNPPHNHYSCPKKHGNNMMADLRKKIAMLNTLSD